jgi:pyruvate kinase
MSESKTQIVATIGPKSGTSEMLRAMIAGGMSVVRLNFSWGTYEEHAGYIERTRAMATEVGARVPIIQDLSGPRAQGVDGHHVDTSRDEVSAILTQKDLQDLSFGLDHDVEYVCMSYVRAAADIESMRTAILSHGKTAKVIGKVERAIAIQNIDEIIAASDAIMIGRGDLGNEVPVETIPFLEKSIIEKCRAAGKPVITATQMLYSMVQSPAPTRAEVTDVAYAVLSGTDAVMLSEETARGEYPLEAVVFMNRIVREAEKHRDVPRINSL